MIKKKQYDYYIIIIKIT